MLSDKRAKRSEPEPPTTEDGSLDPFFPNTRSKNLISINLQAGDG
jgi:hypothetical protein